MDDDRYKTDTAERRARNRLTTTIATGPSHTNRHAGLNQTIYFFALSFCPIIDNSVRSAWVILRRCASTDALKRSDLNVDFGISRTHRFCSEPKLRRRVSKSTPSGVLHDSRPYVSANAGAGILSARLSSASVRTLRLAIQSRHTMHDK